MPENVKQLQLDAEYASRCGVPDAPEKSLFVFAGQPGDQMSDDAYVFRRKAGYGIIVDGERITSADTGRPFLRPRSADPALPREMSVGSVPTEGIRFLLRGQSGRVAMAIPEHMGCESASSYFSFQHVDGSISIGKILKVCDAAKAAPFSAQGSDLNVDLFSDGEKLP